MVFCNEGGGAGKTHQIMGGGVMVFCNEGGGAGKNTPSNGGGFQKMQGKKSKITIAPLL